ncbi:MAG: signal transduction histidine kinase [Bradymonadia bacterium]|jgi:signal transduction histidine kinase
MGGLVAFTALFHVGTLLLRGSGIAVHYWADLGWTMVAGVAAWKCFQTARQARKPHIQRAWKWFGAGCASWCIGMLIWDWFELVQKVVTPFPTIADALFLGIVPLYVGGFLNYKSGEPSRDLTLKQVGDLGVVTCTMVVVCSLLLYQPALLSNHPWLYVSTATAYPIVHISGLLFGLICLWQAVWGRNVRVLLLMILGLACLTAVTTVYSVTLLVDSYQAGMNMDVLWIGAFTLTIAAAFEEDWLQDAGEKEPVRAPAHALDWLVTVGAFGSVGLALYFYRENFTQDLLPVFGIATTFLGLFLGIRHYGSRLIERGLRERLEQLNEELEDRVRVRTIELAAAVDAAEEANATKSRFLASMSHELRTPLNAIIGYSEMLGEDAAAAGNEETATDLNCIRGAGHHLLGLVNNVLDLAKVESGKMDFFIEDVELHSVIEDVRFSIQPMIVESGVALVIEDEGQSKRFRTDSTRLKQVLLNLLSNSAKFTKEGTVTLRVTGDRKELTLTVTDTGIGMTASQLQRSFETFSQAEASTANEYGGTGLGLPISRSICEELGGSLTATSQLGVGSSFVAVLPAA